MGQYKQLLAKDKLVERLLNEFSDILHKASTGDIAALEKILAKGADMLAKVSELLKHSGVAEQTEDDESAAFVTEKNRRSIDYFEFRNKLIDFETEHFQKILAIEV